MRSPIQDCLEIVRAFAGTERKLTDPEVQMLRMVAETIREHLGGSAEVGELKAEKSQLVVKHKTHLSSIEFEVDQIRNILSAMPLTQEKMSLIKSQINKIYGALK